VNLPCNQLPAEKQPTIVQMQSRRRQTASRTAPVEAIPAVEFLSDKPRLSTKCNDTKVQSFVIESALYNQLEHFCTEHNVKQFAVLLAAFGSTHHRLTGISNAEIVVQNDDADVRHDAVGHCNSLQRIGIMGQEASFRQICQDIQSRATGLATSSPENNVCQSGPDENWCGLQRIRTIFALHSCLRRSEWHDAVNPYTSFSQATSEFDIEFHLSQEDQQLRCYVYFAPELYYLRTIENMIAIFKTLLEQGLSSPDTKIELLPLLDLDSYSVLDQLGLIQICRTDYPREASVVDIFRQQVVLNPNKIAVKDSSMSLDYSELDSRSDQLASWIAMRGLEAETPVGVLANRSCQTIVAFLGILKASLAYMPLDISWPSDRIRSILASIDGYKLILLGSDVQAPVLPMEGVHFFPIAEALQVQWDFQNSPVQLTAPSAPHLAYIMFTSCSTGQPRGVMVEHRGISRLVKENKKVKSLPDNLVMAHMANIAFDASTWEIYSALLNGGTLICIDSLTVFDCRALRRVLDRENVRTAFLTPALFKQYLLECPEMLEKLETLVLGGGRIDPQDVLRARGFMKGTIISGYGPTENTVCSTFYCIPESELFPNGVPIGRAIANSGAYVMDSTLQLVPLGVMGELVVTGDGLARGYMDAELNIAQFVSIMINGEPVRAYRTGDLARYRPFDGQLELFGRTDTQAKIRGHRTELGDVENVLGSKNSVGDAAIAVQRSDSPGQQGRAKAARRILAELRDKLPAYMLPSAIIVLDQMPLNRHGKIDRRILCDERVSRQMACRDAKRQPSTQAQLVLQRTWSQVLELEVAAIGLEDNFFELGGDSLSAMQIVCNVRKMGFDLTVEDIFRYPLLQHLAGCCKAKSLDCDLENIQPFSLLGSDVHVPSLLEDVSAQCSSNPSAIQDVYPCTMLQEGLLSLTSRRPENYILQYTLELSADICLFNLQKAWEATIQTTDILRTRVAHHASYGMLQVVLDEAIKWVDVSSLNEYLRLDRTRPMELGQPLTRFALVKDDSGVPRWFVWTVHHALYDGWSLPLILEAVEQAYRGEELQPRQQFKAFIKYAREQDDEKVMEYWRRSLRGCCESSMFPTIRADMAQPLADSVMERRMPRSRKWTSQCLGVTTSTMIRAAWALVTSSMTNSNDVVFGCVVSGRTAPVHRIDDIIAPTIATVPIRIKLPKDQTVWEYLKETQRQSMEMMPFEQAGLQRIARMNSDGRRACMFHTLLVIQPEKKEEGSDQRHSVGRWKDSQKEFGGAYALEIEVQIEAHSIAVSAYFDSKLLEPWIMSRLMERLGAVLHQLEDAKPHHLLTEVSLVTQDDLTEIWVRNGAVPTLVERCVDELVEERTQSQPEAIAVCAWDGQLTYGELERLSARLASHLGSLKGIGMLIPLCFEKSMWTTVAILGVLKLGKAFVLLDPSLPQQRLQAICKQIQASIILSSSSCKALGSRLASQVVAVGPAFFKDECSNVERKTLNANVRSPQAILYVTFTSGTTGVPKGVVISHQNVTSAIRYQTENFGFTPKSRVYDFSSYSFDASINTTFFTLAAGGCICVPSESDRKENLRQSIVSLNANVIDLTPSVAQLLRPEDVPDVQTVILSGEALPVQAIRTWWDKVRVINVYGPSECTATSTMNTDASCLEEATRIGIGIGQITWIVDPGNYNLLTPTGCVGELLLEGPLVGLGYLDDPERTATAFIEDPSWLLQGVPGGAPGRRGRLYRTGDLVRYNKDGSLSFVGRKDTQVKIRGQRVELGEVEHRLIECFPEATRVVAELIHLDSKSAGLTLAAFVQKDGEVDRIGNGNPDTLLATDFSPTCVARHLMALSLPTYMIPTVFFAIGTLPLTVAGKIDRKRLREIGAALGAKESWDTGTANGAGVDTMLAGNSTYILETEQPAYALAKWVFSINQSSGRENLLPDPETTSLPDALLSSCGLDSVNMMSLLYFIQQHFQVKVGIPLLMDRATSIRHLAGAISDSQAAATSAEQVEAPCGPAIVPVDLTAEIDGNYSRIAAEQQAQALQAKRSYSVRETDDGREHDSDKLVSVFLTGGNGFLGTQILRQLIEDSRVARVIALVRGKTDDEASRRTVEAAMKALWWTGSHQSKLCVWAGDLGMPQLGLDSSRWTALAEGAMVNAVIHCGATVHWGMSYRALEAVNVGSTMELLRLAIAAPRMTFVYVTGGRESMDDQEREEDVVEELSTSDALGYSQTKFVAEAVVKRAALRTSWVHARRVSVVSPGCVIGTPTEGIANADDYIWRLVAASISIGMYNADEADTWVPLTDATTTARVIIRNALSPSSQPIVTGFADGMPWSRFWAILEDMGYRLKPATGKEWTTAVRQAINSAKEEHPLWPLQHMLEVKDTPQKGKDRTGGCREEGDAHEGLELAIKRGLEFLGREGYLPLPLLLPNSAEHVPHVLEENRSRGGAFVRSSRQHWKAVG
jgi:amino acid adenylation domain-containing protein/thioester reductase-like protein